MNLMKKIGLSNLNLPLLPIPKFQWTHPRMLFKEVIEMRNFRKT